MEAIQFAMYDGKLHAIAADMNMTEITHDNISEYRDVLREWVESHDGLNVVRRMYGEQMVLIINSFLGREGRQLFGSDSDDEGRWVGAEQFFSDPSVGLEGLPDLSVDPLALTEGQRLLRLSSLEDPAPEDPTPEDVPVPAPVVEDPATPAPEDPAPGDSGDSSGYGGDDDDNFSGSLELGDSYFSDISDPESVGSVGLELAAVPGDDELIAPQPVMPRTSALDPEKRERENAKSKINHTKKRVKSARQRRQNARAEEVRKRRGIGQGLRGGGKRRKSTKRKKSKRRKSKKISKSKYKRKYTKRRKSTKRRKKYSKR